jgi:hypothetical protein
MRFLLFQERISLHVQILRERHGLKMDAAVNINSRPRETA